MDKTIKALTVRQPWASLIASGIKPVENRPWPAAYRGTIAIHAGLATDESGWNDTLGDVPHGAIIGLAELIDCIRDSSSPWAEEGQWHWLLANPRPLPEPVPCRGHLGLWQPPISLEETS